MKITRKQLRRLIEGEVISLEKERQKRVSQNPDTELDQERDPEMELATSAVSGDSEEDWIYDLEGEMEAKMQGMESGKVVDLATEDPFDYDYFTEAAKSNDGNTAYPGQLGIGVDTGDSAKTKQQIEDEITNTTSQLNKLGSSTSDQQQRKVLNDQLQDLQHQLSNS